MYYKRVLKWVQGFELDSTGTAQGLVTDPCKPDNKFSEFHKKAREFTEKMYGYRLLNEVLLQ